MLEFQKFDRVRGIVSLRAEGDGPVPDVAATLRELNNAFGAFRTRNDSRLADLETGLEGVMASVDALRVGGNAGGDAALPGSRISSLAGVVADDFRNMLRGMPSAAMTTQSGPDGGFTVDSQVDRMIDGILRDVSSMRSRARVVSLVEGDAWEKILGRSGAQSAWAGEEDERADTNAPALGKVRIAPHEVYAIPSMTNHLLEDSGFDLNGFVEEDVAGEFSLIEGQAFVTGDGTKKPRGFTTYDTSTAADASRDFGTLQYVATGQSGAFASSDPVDNLHDLLTALNPAYRKGDGVAWRMNSATANVIRKFKDGNDRPLWTDSMIAGQPDRLLGYPVDMDEAMPDIAADAFAVAFGNWRRGYAIVDKPGLKLIVDRVTRKGWTKLYFSRRTGGGVVDSNAIKLLKFSAS